MVGCDTKWVATGGGGGEDGGSYVGLGFGLQSWKSLNGGGDCGVLLLSCREYLVVRNVRNWYRHRPGPTSVHLIPSIHHDPSWPLLSIYLLISLLSPTTFLLRHYSPSLTPTTLTIPQRRRQHHTASTSPVIRISKFPGFELLRLVPSLGQVELRNLNVERLQVTNLNAGSEWDADCIGM